MSTRRDFIKSSIACSIGGITPLADYKNSNLSFDLHAHPGRVFAMGSNDFGSPLSPDKAIKAMQDSELSGAFFALVADAKLIKLGMTGVSVTGKFKPGEGWAEYKGQLEYMKTFFQKFSILQAIKGKDLKQSKSLVAYISVEGGDFLEGQVEKVDESYADGVRSIQLVHYAPNDLGDLQTADPVHHGLSAFGKSVIRRMNKLGSLIDVAHASYKTCKDVVDITNAPIMLSHSILQMEPDRPIAIRAISKDHARLIASTGGIIGAWPSGFNKSFDEYVDNIIRLVDVVGIDHVGIGTDMDANFKPVLDNYSLFPKLKESLRLKGASTNEVDKIMGKNAHRVLKQALQ